MTFYTQPIKIVVLGILGSLLIGCAAAAPGITQRRDIGVESVAPQSGALVISEHFENPATWKLTSVGPSGKSSQTLGDSDDPVLSTNFSPDGKYMLVLTRNGWAKVDATTGKQESLVAGAREVQFAQFLPNGQILIVSNQSDRAQTFTVADPTQSGLPVVKQIDDIRYSFSNQRPKLEVLLPTPLRPNDTQPFAANIITEVTSCLPSASGDAVWLLVKSDGYAFLLAAGQAPNSTMQKPLSANASELIALMEAQREGLLTYLAKTGNGAASLAFSDLIPMITNAITNAKLSPNTIHPRLLFLLIQPDDSLNLQFTLHLLNLETNTQQILSTRTNWMPSFGFSPDGGQIFYEAEDGHGIHTLNIADADGGNSREIAQNVKGACWW